ncbi:MAG: hypothetical protein PHC64_00790 [Candidatus Gastranaerophilales bacterium]|nr:hypothetical protein [Candidatus Gastranaerophilales bacterium]
MKKILSLICLYFAVSLPSAAVLSTDDVMSAEYIMNHGHSEEMAKLMDLQNAQINGVPFKYKNKDPEWYSSNKPVNFIRKVFIYFDGGLDDGKFMQHDTRFTQSWEDI